MTNISLDWETPDDDGPSVEVPHAHSRAFVELRPTEDVHWALVSADRRASMRLGPAMVVGSADCCDLCLPDDEISAHHAIFTIEHGQLFITPLDGAVTRVDEEIVQNRQRVLNGARVTLGCAAFRVEATENQKPAARTAPRAPMVSTPRIDAGGEAPARPVAGVQRRHHSGRIKSVLWGACGIAALVLAPAVWRGAGTADLLPRWQPTESPAPEEPEASAVADSSRAAPAAYPAEAVDTSKVAQADAPASPPARNDDPVAALMAEANALYSDGALLTPPRDNAAARLVKVLSIAPDAPEARARLGEIVARVAADASQMILKQKFDAARELLRRLSMEIPQSDRRFVGPGALAQWRVVELLLAADAMMQEYQIIEPENDNAVKLLREALRIDPDNAIADEMLSKAYGLLAQRQ